MNKRGFKTGCLTGKRKTITAKSNSDHGEDAWQVHLPRYLHNKQTNRVIKWWSNTNLIFTQQHEARLRRREINKPEHKTIGEMVILLASLKLASWPNLTTRIWLVSGAILGTQYKIDHVSVSCTIHSSSVPKHIHIQLNFNSIPMFL